MLDPASNLVENSKNNTTNNDPRNHSSHLISSSDNLLSFFGKSNKNVGSTSPLHKTFINNDQKTHEIQEDLSNHILSEKKNSKKFIYTKSNISNTNGIEEEKKEDDLPDEKEQRLNKQRALEDIIRKDIQRRKIQKMSQNNNENPQEVF